MSDKRKKIFVITQPDVVNTIGGAITVFINFCNLLANNNYEIYGICYSPNQGYPQQLNNNIKFINLKQCYDEDLSFSDAINKLAKDNRPDLFVFFFHYLYIDAQLSAEFDNIPRLLMFHSRPDFYFNIISGSHSALKKVYKNTTTQVLFENYKTLLPDFIRCNNVISIPNIAPSVTKVINTSHEHKKIIYLSRIDNCKGLEFLIHSFKLIANKYPDWSIDIYGQSQPAEYVNSLIKLTQCLKLDKQIKFMGTTTKPIDTFLQYDFCVFPSYFEGFPMGLIEAQSVGLPCVGLEKCSGVNELIINGYNGFLVKENFRDFAKKIEQLITDKNLRKQFSKNTLETTKKFNPKNVNQLWLDTIRAILKQKPLPNTIKYSISHNVSYFPIKKIVNMAKRKHKIPVMQRFCSISYNISSKRTKKILYLLGCKITLRTIKIKGL